MQSHFSNFLFGANIQLSLFIGSAFQWSGTAATTSECVYQWPTRNKATSNSNNSKEAADVRNKQYGDMTRICDLANGNVFVNKEAPKKVRGTISSSSSHPMTLPQLPSRS